MKTICDDVNNGKVINLNFNEWNNVKTDEDYKKWQSSTKALTFGTYKNKTILEVINDFNPKKGFLLDNYLSEVKKAFTDK